MPSEDERRMILEMIQGGKISADEGLRLLKALESQDESGDDDLEEEEIVDAGDVASLGVPEDGGAPAATENEPAEAGQEPPARQSSSQGGSAIPGMKHWRGFWMIPLWVGVGITVLSAFWMYQAQQSSGFGFWFACAWLPFLIGLALLALAWQTRTARWLHIRVQQAEDEWPRNIAISFPIPIGLTAWFLRTFRHKIPGMEKTSVDELIMALGTSTTPENPLYIEVDEGENGEKVQVYIG